MTKHRVRDFEKAWPSSATEELVRLLHQLDRQSSLSVKIAEDRNETILVSFAHCLDRGVHVAADRLERSIHMMDGGATAAARSSWDSVLSGLRSMGKPLVSLVWRGRDIPNTSAAAFFWGAQMFMPCWRDLRRLGNQTSAIGLRDFRSITGNLRDPAENPVLSLSTERLHMILKWEALKNGRGTSIFRGANASSRAYLLE